MSRKLVPEASQGLSKFKMEVARELGVPLGDYNGDLTSRQCGSVGGEMVKRMVEEYEGHYLKQVILQKRGVKFFGKSELSDFTIQGGVTMCDDGPKD